MSGYVIANINVKNPEAYKEYVGKVVPTIQKFGGEYLVRAGKYKVIDGEWKHPRTVIIKFPTYEKPWSGMILMSTNLSNQFD